MDQVTSHAYADAYSKYFELMPTRNQVRRVFEIGLGCWSRPGDSSMLWRRYMGGQGLVRRGLEGSEGLGGVVWEAGHNWPTMLQRGRQG